MTTVAEESQRKEEFELTQDILDLGIERVWIANDINNKTLVYIKLQGITKEVTCQYGKSVKRISKDIENALLASDYDLKKTKKFIARFTKLWIAKEQRARQDNRDRILEEIRLRKTKNPFLTMEQWRRALEQEYLKLKQLVHDNIPNFWAGIEFELSVLRILNIYENTLPFIGIFLGRPGSGKTQIIRPLNDWYCTYYTDDFNARSLVSHNTSFTDEELTEGVDMIPQMKNRLFQTPELAPLFTAKDEDLMKSLGLITRLADGQGLVTNSGAHGQRGYKDDTMFTWIGASVDIPFRVYKVLGSLGFKMYFFRLPYTEKTAEDLVSKMDNKFNSKKEVIKKALFEYLYLFEMGPELIYDNELNKTKWDESRDDYHAKECIANLTILLQHSRCLATTWDIEGTEDYGYTVAQSEDPERAAIALFNLAKGHALLTGRNYVTMDDVPIVLKTVLSSAKIERVGLLFLLIAKKGTVSTDDIVDGLHVSRPTALKTMREFKVIGLVESYEHKNEQDKQYTNYIKLNEEFNWILDPEFEILREEFIPVDNRRFLKKTEGTNKADLPPHRHSPITDEQINIFWTSFETLEKQATAEAVSDLDKDTIGGQILKQQLVQTGKFSFQQADLILNQMVMCRGITKVSYDTYRRKK